MITLFGLPADGVVLFGACIVLIVFFFLLSEGKESAKTDRVSKGKVAQYKKTR